MKPTQHIPQACPDSHVICFPRPRQQLFLGSFIPWYPACKKGGGCQKYASPYYSWWLKYQQTTPTCNGNAISNCLVLRVGVALTVGVRSRVAGVISQDRDFKLETTKLFTSEELWDWLQRQALLWAQYRSLERYPNMAIPWICGILEASFKMNN